MNENGYPDKPKKLTPIFSRKKGEISKIEDNTLVQTVEDPPPLSLPSPVFDMVVSKKNFKRKEPLSKFSPNSAKSLKDEIVSPEFDNIWNSTNLMPQIEENSGNQLPTIGEEFSSTLERSRSTLLGGKVAKINTEQTTQVSYNINKDLENLRKQAESEQRKSSRTTSDNKSLNSKKLEENLLLSDEFKSGSSIFNMDKKNLTQDKINRSLPI